MQCTVVLGSCEITYDMEYAKEFVKLGALVKATDLDPHVHNYL